MPVRLRVVCMMGVALALILAAAWVPARPSRAQADSPAGVVAFAGVDATGQAALYVMDLGSGRVGRADTVQVVCYMFMHFGRVRPG